MTGKGDQMLINDDGLTPTHGELVICDMCGKTYPFFVWAFGSDKHLCEQCVQKTPSADLDNIDDIDIEEEHDVIYEEIDAQDSRDFPREKRRRAERKSTRLSKGDSRRLQRRMDKQVIRKFKKYERSAIDVTGLG